MYIVNKAKSEKIQILRKYRGGRVKLIVENLKHCLGDCSDMKAIHQRFKDRDKKHQLELDSNVEAYLFLLVFLPSYPPSLSPQAHMVISQKIRSNFFSIR